MSRKGGGGEVQMETYNMASSEGKEMRKKKGSKGMKEDRQDK